MTALCHGENRFFGRDVFGLQQITVIFCQLVVQAVFAAWFVNIPVLITSIDRKSDSTHYTSFQLLYALVVVLFIGRCFGLKLVTNSCDFL